MAKVRKGVKTTPRRAGGGRRAKPARASSIPAPIESLREQADRLGLLEPLEDEPAHEFSAGPANESET